MAESAINVEQVITALQQISNSLQLVKTLPSGVLYIKPIVSLGTVTPPTETAVLGESDGTLKISNYGKAGSTLTSIALETSGEQKIVNYGKDIASVVRAFKTETTGEQSLVIYGKDIATPFNLRLLPTNNRLWGQLMIHTSEEWETIAGVELATSEGAIWAPGLGASSMYAVEFSLVNTTTAAITVTLGRDIASGGALVTAEKWLGGQSIPANSTSTFPSVANRPYMILGNDTIRGNASAIGLVMQFHVRRIV